MPPTRSTNGRGSSTNRRCVAESVRAYSARAVIDGLDHDAERAAAVARVLVLELRVPLARQLEEPLRVREAALLGLGDLGVQDGHQVADDAGEGQGVDGVVPARELLPVAEGGLAHLELGRELALGARLPDGGRH